MTLKSKVLVMLLSLCSICFAVQGTIVEMHNMSKIYDYVQPNTLIVFDLDNTLLTTKQELGNDQWFRYEVQKYLAQGLSPADALKKTVAEWTAIQYITQVVIAEKGTAEIIHHLQNQGYAVMGLTTRALDVSTCTGQQLETLNIDLSVTAPVKEEIFFMNDRGVLFRKGILFTANTHKGEALRNFLEACHYSPPSIVFVNDKESHILPIEDFCTQANIPFVGLRYGYLDHRLESFRADIAEEQFKHFSYIPSDEEAAKTLNERK